MGKAKTKKCWLDTLVTLVASDLWEWTTGEYAWRFQAAFRGMNLLCKRPGKDEWEPVLHLDRLNDGVIFTQGWHAGRLSHP